MADNLQQPIGAENALPSEPENSPLACAAALGEYIRIECGKQGVQEFVLSLARLVPSTLSEQLAQRLNAEPPPPPPPLFARHEPPPKRQEMGMDQMMQMMQMMQMFNK